MPAAPIPSNEIQRLEALRRYEILDSLPESQYDDLTALAASICGTPISLVSLVDAERQWFKSHYGMEQVQTPRAVSICAHAIHSSEVFEVPDTARDPRFNGSDFVSSALDIRFYAGAPLVAPGDVRLGTLCVIDRVPRHLSPSQKQALEALARQVVSQLELRLALSRLRAADADKTQALRDKSRALRDLHAKADILNRFVENVPASIAMLDSHWRYVAVSRHFLQSMNLKAGDVLGRNHFEMCSFWPLAWQDVFQRALYGSVEHGHNDVLRPIGHEERIINWQVHPWGNTEAPAEGIIMMIDDVTEARRIEKLKSEFVSVVSHELRTPLTSIRGALGLLGAGVAGALPSSAQTMVSIAHKNAERLVLLINDILDIEKMESGQMSFEMKPLSLAHLVQNALEANAPYAHELGVELHSEAVEDDVQVHGDEARLGQVLANLLSNAAKFTPQNGCVRLRVREVQRGDGVPVVRVEVQDEGPGVPLAFVPRLFERFAQADSSATRAKGGTGLGLAISRVIIERHGGLLGYEAPAPGCSGATFWFELPRLAAQATTVFASA